MVINGVGGSIACARQRRGASRRRWRLSGVAGHGMRGVSSSVSIGVEGRDQAGGGEMEELAKTGVDHHISDGTRESSEGSVWRVARSNVAGLLGRFGAARRKRGRECCKAKGRVCVRVRRWSTWRRVLISGKRLGLFASAPVSAGRTGSSESTTPRVRRALVDGTGWAGRNLRFRWSGSCTTPGTSTV